MKKISEALAEIQQANGYLITDLINLVDDEFIIEWLEEKYQVQGADVTVAQIDNKDEFIFNITLTIPKG